MKPIEVARAIHEGRCPVGVPADWVKLGKCLRAAIKAGYIRENYGCFDDWGGYSVTPEGLKALQ